MQLEILPGVGVGSVRFGMSPAQVSAVFQEVQIYEGWMGGNLNDALLFHGIRFHFDECASHGPLPYSRMNWIVIHGREDASLFDRPIAVWTRETAFQRLIQEGYAPVTSPNGDLGVPMKLELGFESNGYLDWVEIYHA